MRELTKDQLAMLARGLTGALYPGPHGAARARYLVKRGLLSKSGSYGPYRTTDAGRAALHPKDPDDV